MKKFTTRDIAVIGMLTALQVVLARWLSINAWNTRIGFSFVPVVIAAMLYGPLFAGIVGALGDFVGAILFPTGAYFPGFTLTAALIGVIFGLFLYRKQSNFNIVLSAVVNQATMSMLLNSFWISFVYGAPFAATVVSRIPQCILMAVVEIIVIKLLAAALPQFQKVLKR